MCGIVGSYGEQADDLETVLRQMHHRGPDGRVVRRVQNAALGHARLAIVDVEGGDQPLSSPDGKTWLVVNGEIYNYGQLRPQFPHYDFQTSSDSEVILALYERHGADAIRYLDGMFALALVSEDEVLLARDPIGIKPLYYGWDGSKLYFGSEIKALQGRVERIEEFPPGYWYSSKTGWVKYYNLADAGKTTAAQREAPPTPTDVLGSLRSAVQKRLMSDVPLGVFLSGGLDSSAVAALTAQELPGVHSFAVGVEGGEDLEYARRMADYLGTQHHEYVYTVDEMLDALPEIIYHLESFDPSLVRSAIPNYFLSRLTTEYVTVVLTGEGADELYGGYHYLKGIRDDDMLHNELIALVDQLHALNLQRCDRMTMAYSLEGRVPFLDEDFVELSMAVPVDQKIGPGGVEKWMLRKAVETILPDEVTWRTKEQFSRGAGSSDTLADMAEDQIDNDVFFTEVQQVQAETGYTLQSKEELFYYREFRDTFEPSVTTLVEVWRGTMPDENMINAVR